MNGGEGRVVHLVFEVSWEGRKTEAGDENNMTRRCNLRRHNITIFFKKALFSKFQTLRSAWLIRFLRRRFPVVLNVAKGM